jgi:hypothetical protein
MYDIVWLVMIALAIGLEPGRGFTSTALIIFLLGLLVRVLSATLNVIEVRCLRPPKLR